MKHPIYVTLCLLLISFTDAKAQSVKDSSFRIILTGVHISGQLPQNNLAERFGPNLSAGVDLIWKSKKNFLFGIEATTSSRTFLLQK